MRVLVAEDDIDLLDVSSYALRKYGFTVVGVTDGPAALQRWQTDQPDLAPTTSSANPSVTASSPCACARCYVATRSAQLSNYQR